MSDKNGNIFELEKQLHEQYAINNNSNSGAFISLISALLIAMTGYGYVLYSYRICECNDLPMVYLSAFVASVVMLLLYCICIDLGAGQRMEQFVTFSIRAKYYSGKIDAYTSIYPNKYFPFGKTSCSFVQGIYNLLSTAILITICVIAGSVYLLAEGLFYITFGICGILICFCYLYRFCKFRRYKKREFDEYEKHKCFLKRIEPTYKFKLFDCCDYVCKLIMGIFFICSFVLAIMLIISHPIKRDCQNEIVTVRLDKNLDSIIMNVTSRIDSLSVQLNSNFKELNKTIKSTGVKNNKSNDIMLLHYSSTKQVINEKPNE